ncbi:MAG: helix-turn-helix domain-containing protein [Bacteroidota bacterium]|nr:helix-turn-helix domain-containing protein [Bacteroidota bacterium]
MKKGKEDKAAELREHAIRRNGKSGSSSGNIFELELESFKLGMVIREARIFRHLTQEELALKSGTTKYYISRIENNASDIRLSTLMKIICDGLEGKLKFALDFKK